MQHTACVNLWLESHPYVSSNSGMGLLYSNPCGHPGKERVGVRWQAEGRWGEADTWPAECQLLPDDSGMSEPKWSGPGTATVAHPALLSCRERAELPGCWPQLALYPQPTDNRPQRRPTCQELPLSVQCNSLPCSALTIH